MREKVRGDAIYRERVQKLVSVLPHDELAKMVKPFNFVAKEDTTQRRASISKEDATGDMYDNRNPKFGDQSFPQLKSGYVHRSILIRKGYVHFNNLHHRQMVSYFHPWVKGYLERVQKALWSTPPLFIKPNKKEDKEEEDETIKEQWEELRLQAAIGKSWYKSQVHGICFYYPMQKEGFFAGYSGPPWYIYSKDEMGEPSYFIQGHPVEWVPIHSNPNKDEPKIFHINDGVFYDYKLSDDFTGEPFGIGIWDLLIDWIWIEDSVNAFDQRMGNGFLTMVVPNNTDDADIAKYEAIIRQTRTEKGIVIKGAVDEPVELNWVGMAGVQVDFIGHLEKLEDLIAFNMGFPKRWIMGDSEGAMESSGKDALQVNIQLKNLFQEWIIYIKRILMKHNLITNFKDIIIKPPFEMQLSEQEQVELDRIKAETIAIKVWKSIDEQRMEDGLEPCGEEGADKVMLQQEKKEEETGDGEPTEDNSNPTKKTTKKSDTYDQLEEIFTNADKNTVRDLAILTGLSTGSMSKVRAKFDINKNPLYKFDDLMIKQDAVSLGDDLYEIKDVPVILPQNKDYPEYGYNAIRPREEIARIFNDPKYPKEFRIGATLTDDHKSRVPLEVLNENTVGMVKLTRLDEDGNVRGDITYSLKEADRILGNKNYIREFTAKNENIPTSVALYSRDRPTKEGMVERDLDIRSFVFSRHKTRNKKAGI